MAKEQHYSLYGPEIKLDRVKIRRFKNEIRRDFEQGKIEIPGFELA